MRRWALATIILIIGLFGFFIGWSVSNLLLSSVKDALWSHAATLSTTNAADNMVLLQSAFGIICAVSMVLIFIVYIMDSLSEEPEYYWRE